ncbi:hypothetical protein GGH12_005045 [Coemansia sp. RSA 1822]|nr:hypothetical protein IW147_005747 [Coemansia sp. RSA 720]KAJ2539906.1 hypothetical protein GGF49_004872 [Coemansia sp. RSA 1853]KAJ2560169.1 hypothetical protein GGH12_005045 [Coemansia sp. RSA 1822]
MKVLTVLAAALAASAGALEVRAKASTCNGYSELCDKGFDRVAYPTTHNSYATGDNIAANQNKNIRQQLDDGIRGFMLDLYKLDSDPMSDPYLCHTSCVLLNDGKLVDALKDFKTFLDDNHDEVVTIYIENAQPFSAIDMAQAFKDAKLDSYAFAPNSTSSAWPSLAQMIDVNKRLVVFTDRNADSAVPWILDEKSYVVQTPFSVESGASFGCTANSQVRPLWVMNHFVYTNYSVFNLNFERPAPNSAASVNTRASIVGQANACGSAGYFPNFVTVDYYDVGDVFKAVADINGVTYKSTTTDTFGDGDAGSTTSAASVLRPAVVVLCLALLGVY